MKLYIQRKALLKNIYFQVQIDGVSRTILILETLLYISSSLLTICRMQGGGVEMEKRNVKYEPYLDFREDIEIHILNT